MLRVSLPLHGCVARRFYGIPPAKRAPGVVPRCAARQFRVPCANTPPLYFGVLILATFWHFADLAQQQRSLTARLSSPGDSLRCQLDATRGSTGSAISIQDRVTGDVCFLSLSLGSVSNFACDAGARLVALLGPDTLGTYFSPPSHAWAFYPAARRDSP